MFYLIRLKEAQKPTVMLTSYILIIAGILLLMYFLWSRRRYYTLILDLPGPLGLPLLGSVPEYCINNCKLFAFMVRLYNSKTILFQLI